MDLSDLPKSPERKLLEATATLLKADALIAGAFKPILVLESPTRRVFVNLAAGTMAIQAFQVKEDGKPSGRSVTRLGVLVSAFLPSEDTEADSDFVGLDLGSYLRSLTWDVAVEFPGYPSPISFATTDFRQMTPLVIQDAATRVLSYLVTLEADVDPREGDFSG